MSFDHATRLSLGGCPIDLYDLPTVLSEVRSRLTSDNEPPLAIASGNVDHLFHFGLKGAAHKDLPYDRADFNWWTLLDGAPLVLWTKRATKQTHPKLSGSDLILPMLEIAQETGAVAAFIGGTTQMHAALRVELAKKYPNLRIGGMWAPERSELSDDEANKRLAAEVKAAGVDFLVVGLGKPRQEVWIDRYGALTGARMLVAFGAAADFLAGHVQRAPSWAQDNGMEWAYRLIKEPRRLYRRYLLQGPPALCGMVRTPVLNLTPVTPEVHPPAERQIKHVAVITVTYNSRGTIDALLTSVREESHPGLDVSVVVVDNGSTDGCLEHLQAMPDIALAHGHGNVGYAAGINVGRERVPADADAIAILNPDIVVEPGCLRELASALRDGSVGVVVPQVRDADGHLFHSLRRDTTLTSAVGDALFGEKLPTRPRQLSDILLQDQDYRSERDVDWASGAAWMVASDCDEAVGDWFEGYFMYSEEAHTARRVRECGYKVRYIPSASLRHIGGASGASAQLEALQSVNREYDFAMNHSSVSTGAYRAVNLMHHALRSYQPTQRESLQIIASRRQRAQLPNQQARQRNGNLSRR